MLNLCPHALQLSESHSVLTLHLCEKPACAFNREQKKTKKHGRRTGSNAVGDHISGSSSITYWSVNTDSHQVTNIVVHVSSIRLLIAREHVGSPWSLSTYYIFRRGFILLLSLTYSWLFFFKQSPIWIIWSSVILSSKLLHLMIS